MTLTISRLWCLSPLSKFCRDMVALCFILTIYFKFGFILINNNICSAHTVHTYYLITRTNINLIFELCKLITGKQKWTPQLPKAQIFMFPIISLIFPFLSISQLPKLFYFSTISYLDCREKINKMSCELMLTYDTPALQKIISW